MTQIEGYEALNHAYRAERQRWLQQDDLFYRDEVQTALARHSSLWPTEYQELIKSMYWRDPDDKMFIEGATLCLPPVELLKNVGQILTVFAQQGYAGAIHPPEMAFDPENHFRLKVYCAEHQRLLYGLVHSNEQEEKAWVQDNYCRMATGAAIAINWYNGVNVGVVVVLERFIRFHCDDDKGGWMCYSGTDEASLFGLCEALHDWLQRSPAWEARRKAFARRDGQIVLFGNEAIKHGR